MKMIMVHVQNEQSDYNGAPIVDLCEREERMQKIIITTTILGRVQLQVLRDCTLHPHNTLAHAYCSGFICMPPFEAFPGGDFHLHDALVNPKAWIYKKREERRRRKKRKERVKDNCDGGYTSSCQMHGRIQNGCSSNIRHREHGTQRDGHEVVISCLARCRTYKNISI